MTKSHTMNRFSNLAAGLGTDAAKSERTHFQSRRTNYDELIAIYDGNWLAAKAVDIPINDMMSGFRVFDNDGLNTSGYDASLSVANVIKEALTYQSVTGGALVYFETGANESTARKEGETLIRLQAISADEIGGAGKTITNPKSPYFRLPEHIQIGGSSTKIHISRLSVIPHHSPFANRANHSVSNGLFNKSYVEKSYDLLVQAGAMVQGIEDLFWEKKTDTYKIPDLMEMCATDEGTTKLLERFSINQLLRSSYNASLLDTDEEHISNELSLNGVRDNVMLILTLVAASADIPVTRMLGVSASGLNSNGEGDIQNYFQMIEARKHSLITPTLNMIDSYFDAGEPWHYKKSRQLSERQDADIDTAIIANTVSMVSNSIVTEEAALRYLLANSRVNLTDDELSML